MWYFKEESGKIHYLGSAAFVVGRNRGDLVLSDDNSISRAHAKIQVHGEKCIVTDTGSKYGTFLLDGDSAKQIAGDCTLRSSDRVRFGLQRSIVQFTRVDFVVLTSSLTSEDREKLEEVLNAVGGRIATEWTPDCTHLTVSSTKLTAKLTASLAAGLPIVTVGYWQALRASLEANEEPPRAEAFCPRLEDAMFQTPRTSLLPDPRRRSIFGGQSFVHFTRRQFDTYARIIELAGGQPLYFGDQSFDRGVLSSESARLVLFGEENSQEEGMPDVAKIQRLVKRAKRRMIPESEIPLAILHASADNYCNPDFSFETLLRVKREQASHGRTLVEDTQEVGQSGRFGRRDLVHDSEIVPETESMSSLHSQAASKPSNGRVEEREEEEAVRASRKRLRSTEQAEDNDKRAKTEKIGRVFSCIKRPAEAPETVDRAKTENAEKSNETPRASDEGDKKLKIRQLLFSSRTASLSNGSSPSEENAREESPEDRREQRRDERSAVDLRDVEDGEAIENQVDSGRELEESEEELSLAPQRPTVDGPGSEVEGEEEGHTRDANYSGLRPEFFRGVEFGKKFRKVRLEIPQRAAVQ